MQLKICALLVNLLCWISHWQSSFIGIPGITHWQWPHTIQPSVKKVWLWHGGMEEKCGASSWPWTTTRLRVVGFGWWNWMGTSDINGSIQSTTKNQCKSSFSLSLLWQGRPFGTILHAKTEAATLSSYATRLWGSCQMDYPPNGKIRNQAGWWIHGSSTPGDESLYLNHIKNLPSLQEFYAGWSSHSILFFFFFFLSFWLFRKWISLRRRPVLKGMCLLQFFVYRESL